MKFAQPGQSIATDGMAPRERILAVAGALFYRHGIRAVGVDAIADPAQQLEQLLLLLRAQCISEQVVDLQAIRRVSQLVSHASDRNNDARTERAWWVLGRVGRWHARW